MPEPLRFRRRPIEVDAIQWDGSEEGAKTLARWAGGAVRYSFHIASVSDGNGGWTGRLIPDLIVTTPEGMMNLNRSDWLVKGRRGEFYPYKPNVFADIYEAV